MSYSKHNFISGDVLRAKPLNEMDNQIYENAKKISEVSSTIEGKVDKEEGKVLSTNDYDNASKAKVDAIPKDPKYTDTVYDDTEVKKDLNQIKDVLAYIVPTFVCQSSGNVIALDDSSNHPFCGLNLYGKTTQDGTPTPEAPVELVSVGDSGSVSVMVCGKNLFADGKVYNAGLDASYGQLSTNNPVTSPVNRTSWGGVGIRVAVSPNNTYTVSSDITPCRYFTVTFYKEFDSVGSKANAISFKEFANINNATFTTPENCYCVVITSVSNVESDFTWSWWQVEHGSAATVYEPYEGQTLSISTPNGLPGIPVTSGGNYTDANGQQWICDEVNFARGKLIKRVLAVRIPDDLKGGEISLHSNFHPYDGISRFCYRNTELLKPASVLMSNLFPFSMWVADGEFIIPHGQVGQLNIQIRSDRLPTDDISGLLAWAQDHPITILAQMTTPVETDLSEDELAAYAALHTYKPNTTIYNDSDAHMEISYQADTKLYIDKQFAELRNAIVSLGGNI